MKKVILTLLAVFTVAVNANALSVERAREEARFLTDKMMYELNLTEDQADDVYEINYDYFRALGPVDGIYDMYYDRRYQDLSYVLYDWQWEYFLDRAYFLRPAYIYRGGWAFGIYNYYVRTHFYFGFPRVYYHYNGGHYHHVHYYRDRFDMHRHAVSRIQRVDRRPTRIINGNTGRNRIADNRGRNTISRSTRDHATRGISDRSSRSIRENVSRSARENVSRGTRENISRGTRENVSRGTRENVSRSSSAERVQRSSTRSESRSSMGSSARGNSSRSQSVGSSRSMGGSTRSMSSGSSRGGSMRSSGGSHNMGGSHSSGGSHGGGHGRR